MTFKLEKHPGIALKKAARLFEQVANKLLDGLGATHAQTVILIRLLDKDGQNQSELTRSAGLDQSTVVRLLDRMERDDLIKRARNKEDKRVFNFFLTSKGKKICQELATYSVHISEIAHESLSSRDQEKLTDMISVITNNLENYLENFK